MSGRNLQARDGSILVICTGNVCRSPYIERLLRARLGGTGILVTSAGTDALVGSDMDPMVAQRLARTGGDSEGFSARQLTADLAAEADLILCATRQHRSQVVQMAPRVLRRTYALADFADLAARLARSAIPLHSDVDSYVSQVSAAAEQARGSVQPRTTDAAVIVDPFRQSKKVFDKMFIQVEQLLPPIIAALTDSPPRPISVADEPPVV